MAGNGWQFVGKSGCAKKGKRESAPDSFFALTTRPENSDSVWPASFGQIGAKYDKREVQDLRNLLGQSEMILPHCGKEKEKKDPSGDSTTDSLSTRLLFQFIWVSGFYFLHWRGNGE